MYILSPDSIRELEDKANETGLTYKKMMLNAGKGCAEKIIKTCGERRKTAIICGKGKNGGDGYVIASVLQIYHFDVTVINAFDETTDELADLIYSVLRDKINTMSLIFDKEEAEQVIADAEIVVDAVFGIGFKGELPEHVSDIFAKIRNKKSLKYAVDIPSGLTAEDENSVNYCFRADHTMSMLCLKKEHVYKPFSSACGKVSVIPIGFEPESDTGLFTLMEQEVREMLPERPYDANKGSMGHTLIVAGSYKMPGAAILATKGALSMGAGLVTLAFPDCCYPAITAQLSENIMFPMRTADDGSMAQENLTALVNNPKKYASLAFGCGTSPSSSVAAVLTGIIKNYPGTLIIDADGINLLAKNIDILKEAVGDIILTPHPAEMSRLNWSTVKEINASREKTAMKFAHEFGVTVLLKGPNTVIACPDGRMYINPTGSSALSRGGSGDLLTGMIASLAANGLPPFEAACLGSFIHGLAGEIAEEKYTAYSSTVARITDSIPDALLHLIKEV